MNITKSEEKIYEIFYSWVREFEYFRHSEFFALFDNEASSQELLNWQHIVQDTESLIASVIKNDFSFDDLKDYNIKSYRFYFDSLIQYIYADSRKFLAKYTLHGIR